MSEFIAFKAAVALLKETGKEDILIEAYQKAKEKEWTKYQSQITKWEIENYLYLI